MASAGAAAAAPDGSASGGAAAAAPDGSHSAGGDQLDGGWPHSRSRVRAPRGFNDTHASVAVWVWD